MPDWHLDGVIAGEGVGAVANAAISVRADAGVEQVLWPGFALQLYKDGAESYWYNLVGRTPSVFVVCRENGDGELEPVTVTANCDEANAHVEADDVVFAAPMPPEIYRWIEQFVVTNYVPRVPRKRKRKAWTEETPRDETSR